MRTAQASRNTEPQKRKRLGQRHGPTLLALLLFTWMVSVAGTAYQTAPTGQEQVPLPRDVQAAELADGQYLGELVRLQGTLLAPENSGSGRRNFRLADQTGEVRIELPVRFFNDAAFAKRLHLGGSLELVGVVNRYPDGGQEQAVHVRPRETADFHFAALLPYREIAIVLLAVIVIGKLIMLAVLRSKAEKRARELTAISATLKKSEEKLLESNHRLATLVKSAPLAIIVLDNESKVRTWNPASEQMFGWKEEEVAGQPLPVVSEARLQNLKQYMERIGRGEILRGEEVQPRRKNGSLFDASLSLSPLYDEEGRVNGSIAILRDITANKRAEAALRSSEERYRQLFENAGDMIYTRDFAGKMTSANKGTERMTGYTREELVGSNMVELVAPEDREKVASVRADLNRGDPNITREIEIQTKSGQRIALEVRSQLIYEDGKAVEVLGIGRDISERKRLQAQLLQAQKMEAIGRLAGGVAHDFNNLLNVIGGYSELMLSNETLNDAPRRYVGEIQKASARAASLTRQLLAFSRKQVMQPKVLNLNDVVAETDKMLRRLIGEDIQLTTVPHPELGQVKADHGQIEQVIMNLAVNARDAMPAGGALSIQTANVELDDAYARWHPGCQPGPYVQMTVSDTGAGMSAETRLHLFEPFFTTKPLGQGTGLGLATVYGIVKQSGGYIWVYSELGQGTIFKIYFPRIKTPAQTAAPDQQPAAAPTGSETILVVEDELAMRELAQEFLRSSGYHVLEAERGSKALELARQYNGPIHMMLSDVIMPGMTGRELAEQMAQVRPEMKVLFMSGYTDDMILHQGISDLGTAFLQKPFDRAALGRKVREVLDRQPQHPEGEQGLTEIVPSKLES